MAQLIRPRSGRIFAGVCVGIARRFGWAPWLVRLAFLLSMLLPGPQILIYVAMWILVPNER
ncbi:PspC domain-containing protein [Naasia lichenicola]|uniref:PspC domain-containing protein n=1 Tax=Naasia lichenicola TaxID=2565933 RepID=A0A4S4FFT4_9MICO|nr:PspC domain-containing protein [Naasia lichenicola]THG28602.1 PspC domain-containing protein [Naasia lichenicola]